MSDASHVKLNNVNVDLTSALNNTLGSISDANDELRSATAAQIEKRGFTYPGDRHQGWGLGGNSFNSAGFTGSTPYYGRGLELQLNSFSLQPFGIGSQGMLGGGSISSSIFSNKGAGAKFSKTTHVARMKMALCVEAYKGFGIVKNVIDLMCNFASEGITISHPSPAVQRFYQRWFEAVDIPGRVKHGLRSYYKTGNVFIYTTMGDIDTATYRKMRSTRGAEGDPLTKDVDVVDNNDPNTEVSLGNQIPWRYVYLNPFQMDLRGAKFFGEQEWVFVLDEDARKEVKRTMSEKNVDNLEQSDVNLPQEFKRLIEDGSVVKLEQDKLWTMHYMKDDHEDWADPMVWPVMNDIMYKNSLRSMDMSVVNSTINAITIFKLGSVKDGFVAPASHYKKLSNMLRTPTYSHNIVWNDAISMESNYPPIEKILSQDKYKSVDRDILAGMGIPGILVNGAEGGSFSNAFLQVRTLLERLEDGRTEIMKWLTKQLRLVAEAMGHREIPTVSFGQMSLRDEEAIKKLIIQLADRNLISAESVQEAFGYSPTIELERMRREKKLADEEDILQKFGPYRDPMNFLSEEDMMDKQNDMDVEKLKIQEKMRIKQTNLKTQQQNKKQNSKGPQGRPGGVNTKQEVKRKAKPKGMGLGYYEDLRTKAMNAYKKVEDYLTALTVGHRGVTYKKELIKEDRDALEGLISVVYSNVKLDEEITEEYINSLLVNASLNDSVAEAYEFNSDVFGDNPSAEQRRKIRAISLAQYHFEVDDDAI